MKQIRFVFNERENSCALWIGHPHFKEEVEVGDKVMKKVESILMN